MLTLRPSAERGSTRLGWLESKHTFSFGGYHDPEHMGYSMLRVVNDDEVAPGGGFQTHGHRDMEILSYVLRGTLEHRDSLGNSAKMPAGDVQLMSAGRGIQHSEFNSSDTEGLRFLQMWVIPAEQGTEPRYEQKGFARQAAEQGIVLAASSTGEAGSLTLGQDVKFYVGHLTPERQVEFSAPAGRKLWVQVASGELQVGELTLEAGDGAAIDADGSALALTGVHESDFVAFDLP